MKQAKNLLQEKSGTTLVVCGDTPLITGGTFQALINYHEQTKAKATILTAEAPNPTGYGRVIRNGKNQVERIVEHKDASEDELLINEINTGTYCFDNQALFEALNHVSNDNAQGEYYLPDVIEIMRKDGQVISAYKTEDFEETIGINDRIALSQAEAIMRKRIVDHHMRQGVTITDPNHTYIGLDVTIGQDVIIHPGTTINGNTTIGEDSEIGPNTEISQCQIGKSCTIKQSILNDSVIGNDVEIGPFAYIRPGSEIAEDVKIGRFVEIKNAKVGQESKIPHLSYIGDALIGNNVNVGCGTITVNYDGKEKHLTTIHDEAFIGCNANLVAPVTIGKGSLIAAGSTITNEVPEESLSIARAKQINKEGYVSKLNRRKKD